MFNELKLLIPTITHLPNEEKTKRLMAKGISCADFLEKAEELYSLQMAKDNITWPPACHAKDSKAVPKEYREYAQANLAKTRQMSDNDGDKKTFILLQIPPSDSASSTGSKDGHPVYEQKVYGLNLYWYAKCKFWTKSHSTGGHIDNYKSIKRKKEKEEKDETKTDPESNYASGIFFDPSIWHCPITNLHLLQEEQGINTINNW